MQRGRGSIFVYTGDFGNRKRHRFDCYAGLVQPTSFSRASPFVSLARSSGCADRHKTSGLVRSLDSSGHTNASVDVETGYLDS